MSTRIRTSPGSIRWRADQAALGPPRIVAWLALITLVLAGIPAIGTAQDSPPFPLADLDGRWIQRDAHVDAALRRSAIDTAIQPLSWVVRKMAGGVLHATTAPDPTVHFVWDGRRLHQRFDGKRGVTVRPVEPGSPATEGLDSRGEPFEGQWIWARDGLAFSWRQHQAYGTNLYRVDPTRRELTIDHAIHVTALEGVLPIVYRSRFVQAALPAVSAAGDPGVP